MSKPLIYLDNAATTPVHPEVKAAMEPFLSDANHGNPSSLHQWGKQAKKALEQARQTVAGCINAAADEIIFTSGGTEADNLAVLGVTRTIELQSKNNPELSLKRHIITSAIEHSAIAKPCAFLEECGWDVTYLPVDQDGFVSLGDLQAAVKPETALVSIMHGNNEIGTIQPIEAIGAYLRERKIPFHTDAVQTAGKLPIDVKTLPVDYLSVSAHKIYGPKGAGFLYVRRGSLRPTQLLFGGGQESRYRSGTENVPGIVGLAKALELACAHLPEEIARLRELQSYFIQRIQKSIPTAVLNGPADLSLRAPGNVHFSFPPAEGEALVLQLDLKGIAVSTGSACKSANIAPSAIILAMNKPEPVAQATVRFSIGRTTTKADLDATVEALQAIMAKHLTSINMTQTGSPTATPA